MTTLLNTAGVAARLAITLKAFYHQRAKLEAAGFPRPVAGLGAMRWDPAAIDAWLRAQRDPRTTVAPAAFDPHNDDWAAELDRRAGAA